MQTELPERTTDLVPFTSENITETKEDFQEEPKSDLPTPIQPERGIREIDENIAVNVTQEPNRRSDIKLPGLKESSEYNVKDTEKSVTRLLEKLLAERKHLIELGIIKKELAERQDKENRVCTERGLHDQENVDPATEGTNCNPNAKTVKGRQSLNSTVSRNSTSIRSIESTLNKYGHCLPNLTAKYQAKKTETHHFYEEESQYSYDENEAEPNELQEENTEEPIDKKATIKTRIPRQLAKPIKTPKITDLIYLNKTNINFGTTLPGQIVEENIELVNQSNENIVVQIVVNCINAELAGTDEYVYAIRRSHSSDYNDKHFVIMSPYSSAQFKIALKAPSVRIKDVIRGETVFTVQGVEDSVVSAMESKQVIPKLACPKELYHAGLGRNVIKLAVKNNKKLESKIPFKNLSEVPLTLDLEFYRSKETQACPYDVACYPAAVVMNQNAMSLINITVKPSADFNKSETKSFTRILTAKCRDTSLTYSFIVCIDVCE